jgi:hypothetical protein
MVDRRVSLSASGALFICQTSGTNRIICVFLEGHFYIIAGRHVLVGADRLPSEQPREQRAVRSLRGNR